MILPESGEALALMPGEAVGTPSLEVLKARLDGALGSLIWWVAPVCMAGGGSWMIFKVLSSLKHSMI